MEVSNKLNNSSKWAPSIDDVTEIIGIILIFIPYLIILLPLLQRRIVIYFQRLYLHRTPRNDWNGAVDQHPPRRLLGYIFSLSFTFSGIILLELKNHTNNYWLDCAQYFIYLSLPLIFAIIRPPYNHPCDFWDFIIISFVIVPIEASQEYDNFLPDIQFTIYTSWGNTPNISILRIAGFNLLLFIFFIFRPLNNIGLGLYDVIVVQRQSIKWILLRFMVILVIFLSIAIPFCLIPSIKYLHAPESLNNVWIDGIARYFCLFFFKILLLEFLYRGVIQNLLHSAFDFRQEAMSYLRGRKESLTDILNQFDESSVNFDSKSRPLSPHDASEVLWNNNSNPPQQQIQQRTFNIVDPSKSINNAMDAKALPYYEGDDDAESDNRSSFDDGQSQVMYYKQLFNQQKRNTMSCSDGICFCLRFDAGRDWLIIIITSFIYALTIIDYKHFEKTEDLIYGTMLMFWLGFCSGWIFRLTNSCLISAIFNSLIFFNFKYIFNPQTSFCNGAC